MKKITLVFFIFFTALILASCNKITIKLDNEKIQVSVGSEFTIKAQTNDNKGLTFLSEDPEIVEVNNDGLVHAKKVGRTRIKILSNSKNNRHVFLTIEVLEISEEKKIILASGMEYQIPLESGEYSFNVDNEYIATVSNTGLVKADLTGITIITIIKDSNIFDTYEVKVMNKAKEIKLSGPSEIFNNDLIKYEVNISPNNSYNQYEFISLNEDIFEVNKEGIIYPKGLGTATLKVRSLQDEETFSTIDITIMPVNLVSKTKDSLKLGNWTYKKGIDLFDNINDALSNSLETGKIIINDGTFDEGLIIDKSIHLLGIDGVIENKIEIRASNVTIQNLEFTNKAQITSNDNISNMKIINNRVHNIKVDEFINLSNYSEVIIANNNFENLSGNAINLTNINGNSSTLIEKNSIKDVNTAINLESNRSFKEEGSIRIYRNKVDYAKVAFRVDLGNENLNTTKNKYARFNEVTNYEKAIIQIDNSNFEYTFNYWDNFTDSSFENVHSKYLVENYKDRNNILEDDKYDSKNPIIASLGNKLETVWLGETYELDIVSLPYSASRENIVISIDNTKIMDLTSGKLTPLKTGIVELKVVSFADIINPNIYELVITTDPGIHFEIDKPTNDLVVGSNFTIKSLPYPFNLANDKVIYSSSNPSISTVDENGLVKIIGVGSFEITAEIEGYPISKSKLILESYQELDDNKILDFFIKNQNYYSKVHELTIHGVTMAARTINESVNRVSIYDYEMKEKLLPENTPNFRPTIPFNSDIPKEYKFNNDNVVWIVVHDTGNSNIGAGAELHANYLYQQATQNGRQASWHYTVDNIEAYNHIPDNEVAYHAGDGSSKPSLDKESPALGGGNRNGIGIEMSIQRDQSPYITWQNTAKLVSKLLVKYNLPVEHQKFHNDFSGKECPQTLRKAGLVPLFQEFIQNEYDLLTKFGNDFEVELISRNPDILNTKGSIIKTPNKTTQVSYDLVIKYNNDVFTKTFTTIVEGLWR